MNTPQKIIVSVLALVATMFAEGPGFLWVEPDIVIDSAKDFRSISVATRRSNGEIYVAASAVFWEDTTRYGIRVWRSPDGINWTRYLWFSITDGHLYNPSMTIFTTADSEYLFLPFDIRRPGFSNDIRALRRNLVSQADVWINVATNANLSEIEPAVCDNNRLNPNNPLLFCAYRLFSASTVDSICFVRSTDYGITWSQRRIVGTGESNRQYCASPDCDFGLLSSSDSCFVGVTWEVWGSELSQIRFRLNTYNGLANHWRPIYSFTPPANYEEAQPKLRMAFGHPSAVITHVRWDPSGNADLCRSVTTDGGSSWSTIVHFNSATAYNVPHALAVDDTLGFYHLAFRDQDNVMKYQKARFDSAAAPWSTPFVFSSGNISDRDFPAIGVRNRAPYVCWVDSTSPGGYRLKFDAQWLQSGVKGHNPVSLPPPVTVFPNLARGSLTVAYQVNRPGRVSIVLYDATGREVRSLLDADRACGRHETEVSTETLPAGVYIVGVATPDGRWAKRVVVVK